MTKIFFVYTVVVSPGLAVQKDIRQDRTSVDVWYLYFLDLLSLHSLYLVIK
jgi:hypothetical protein